MFGRGGGWVVVVVVRARVERARALGRARRVRRDGSSGGVVAAGVRAHAESGGWWIARARARGAEGVRAPEVRSGSARSARRTRTCRGCAAPGGTRPPSWCGRRAAVARAAHTSPRTAHESRGSSIMSVVAVEPPNPNAPRRLRTTRTVPNRLHTARAHTAQCPHRTRARTQRAAPSPHHANSAEQSPHRTRTHAAPRRPHTTRTHAVPTRLHTRACARALAAPARPRADARAPRRRRSTAAGRRRARGSRCTRAAR